MRTNRFIKYASFVTVALVLSALLGVTTDRGKQLLYKYSSNSFLGRFCTNLIVVEATTEINSALITINLNNSKTKNKPIFKGDKIYWLPHDYGRDIFDIYYNGKLLGKANVFSTNSWHNHIYNFRMSMKGDKVQVDFIADGPDGPGEFIYTKDINRN